MAVFHEVQFPDDISRGSTGGPERRTDIVQKRSGFEERNAIWANSLRKYNAGVGIRSSGDIHDIIEFFEARMGRLYGFRWKDWTDFRSRRSGGAVTATDQIIGTGTGALATFQLIKTYTSGPSSWSREIKKPVAGTVKVAVNGVTRTQGSHWNVDTTTGVITFTGGNTPASGAQVTAGFEFDVPARFDTDFLDLTVDAFEAGSISSVPIQELRL